MKLLLLFLIVFLVSSQSVEIDYTTDDSCSEIFTRSHIKTNTCLENTLFNCTSNNIAIYNCQDKCSRCTINRNGICIYFSILVNATGCHNKIAAKCSTTPQVLDVGEGGFTVEVFAKDDCTGTPYSKNFTRVDQCIGNQKLFCTNQQVQLFVYEESGCEGSPDSRILYRSGECAFDSRSGMYTKLVTCGNEFVFPDWGWIVVGVGSGVAFIVFCVSTPILIWYNVIRKGGYYNPVVEEERSILKSSNF